jgi:hypothetical protein
LIPVVATVVVVGVAIVTTIAMIVMAVVTVVAVVVVAIAATEVVVAIVDTAVYPVVARIPIVVEVIVRVMTLRAKLLKPEVEWQNRFSLDCPIAEVPLQNDSVHSDVVCPGAVCTSSY